MNVKISAKEIIENKRYSLAERAVKLFDEQLTKEHSAEALKAFADYDIEITLKKR